MKIILMLLMLVLAAGAANAATGSGEIKHFYINDSKKVMVGFVSPHPGCGTTAWQFEFSMDSPVGKEWVSMLLMAKASGSMVNINYSGVMPSSGHCDVTAIWFNQ